MTDPIGREYMAEALRLAGKGILTTSPNPRVGCLLVRDAEVVGRGWHERAGEPHAEINALRDAGDRGRGATAYVTLEPCSHHGRTPPCADALIGAGVSRVVAGMKDPNPRVSGQGLERLKSAGLDVECGLLERQCRDLNRGFVRRHERGRPWVTLKLAASLDGRTAMASGESKWITSRAARIDVQRLRAGSCAVMTGIGTILSDDPGLDVRLTSEELGIGGNVRQPARVIVDSCLRTPPGARILGLPGEILIYTAEAATGAGGESLGDRVIRVPLSDESGRVCLDAVLADLARRGMNEVLVEAGATLAGALVQAGLADEIVLYLAPQLLGSDARGLVDLVGVERMQERVELEWIEHRMVGADLRLRARPRVG